MLMKLKPEQLLFSNTFQRKLSIGSVIRFELELQLDWRKFPNKEKFLWVVYK